MFTLNSFGISMEEAIERFSIFAGKPPSRKKEDIISGEGLALLPHKADFIMTDKEFICSGRGIPPRKGEREQKNGEVYYTVDTNQIYGYKDNDFIELSPGKVLYSLPETFNCRNCGAPVKGCKCEYCGTVY